MYSNLLKPIQIGTMTLTNRLVMPPMAKNTQATMPLRFLLSTSPG